MTPERDVHTVLRTNASVRQYTDTPVPDEVLHRILDTARFAPSGGNKQAWHVMVLRDPEIRARVDALAHLGWNEYMAQNLAGLRPFAADETGRWQGPRGVDFAAARAQEQPWPFGDSMTAAPVLLVVAADLTLLSAMDCELDRVRLAAGGSVYPFAHSILLAARAEGLGGVMTTFLIRQEPAARELLGLPQHWAIAALVAIGEPVKQLTKLARNPVESFTTVDRFDGPTFRV